MPPVPDVIDRLLIAKGLLSKIRFLPAAHPDRISLAQAILTAHDAAELASAAVARHLNCLPASPAYLMGILAEIKKVQGATVAHRDHFSKLNTVRNSLKHEGIFPDPQHWYRVGEQTYDYVSEWCQQYLGLSLDELDESALIANQEVKVFYDKAEDVFRREQYKETLENLAFATEALLRSNQALRNLRVGKPRAEDAIKLAAFGVHANDYLALQEFIPSLFYDSDENLIAEWDQQKYGHPGNWTRDASAFCLKTFVDVALRIQDADRIPGAIEFDYIYEHKITALDDGVEIVQEKAYGLAHRLAHSFSAHPERVVVRTINKDESILGKVSRKIDLFAMSRGELSPILLIKNRDQELLGEVEANKVRVTCVPRDDEIIRRYFPDLPEVEYES